MRVCALSLPELRIELVRARAQQEAAAAAIAPELKPDISPLAVVVAAPPLTETKLLGNTRLSVVSREARALGVLPGQTIAQARARASHLQVRVVRPDAVRDVLARLAEVGLAFGATVAFGGAGQDPPSSGAFGDVVWIDVTGCAHLHAPPPVKRADVKRADDDAGPDDSGTTRGSLFDGETILAARLAGVVASLGHTCSVAIADGPRVAAMLARAQAEAAVRAALSRGACRGMLGLEPIVIRPGANAPALGPLPVTALPLSPEDVRWLGKLGVRTIEDLRALPRDGLGQRLGASARDVLALAAGDDRAPLTPYVPPETPVEDAALEYGVEGTQALTFVAKTLTDRLALRLQGRAVAAARLELELRLDAGMLRATAHPSAVVCVALDLPAPLSEAGDLLAALRPRIDRLVLEAPVLGAQLRAPVLVQKRAAALSLFEPRPKAERALPRLVAELVSDLGPAAVSTLVLGDSWVPEERSRHVGFGARAEAGRTKKKPRHLLSSVPEPTRLLARPRTVLRENVRVTRHLSRVEALEWWKEAPDPTTARRDASDGGRPRGVDYVQAWTEGGAAWVEIDRRTGAMRVRGWFD